MSVSQLERIHYFRSISDSVETRHSAKCRCWTLLVLIGLIWAGLSSSAAALDPHRALTQALQRIWQVPQGLPQPTILSVLQSSDGFIWLGTQAGLVRFDGVRFAVVRNTSGVVLEKIWVTDLAEDHEHRIWVATDGAGVIRVHRGEAKAYTRLDGLPSNEVRAILADRDGTVWVATADGLARIGKEIKTFRAADGLATDDLKALSETPDGKLWIGGDSNQLTVWDGANFSKRALSSLSSEGSIHALQATADGTVWIGTTSGLVRLKGDEERRFTTADGLAHDDVLSLALGRDGKSLWAGAKEGFSRVQDLGKENDGGKKGEQAEVAADPARKVEIDSFHPSDGLSQSTVYSLCEDREGSLWVGTKHGLNQFADRRTLLYSTREGLPSSDGGPILQDASGTIWAGTLGGGLGRFDGRRFAVISDKDGLPSNTILALANGEPGTLWIGTDKGLSRLREGRVDKNYSTDDGLPSATVWCLCRDRQGTLWAGTSAGLAHLKDDRFARPDGEADVQNLPIRAIVERRDGSLLAAADGEGLVRFADGKLTAITNPALARREVDAFYEDAEGLLWIGTVGSGLFLLDGDQVFNFTSRNGLFDDDIFGIVADEENRLWMACSKGIFFITEEDLKNFSRGLLDNLTSTQFGPMEAQRIVECKGGVQPSNCRARDGKVWFSTTRGMIVIDSRHLKRDIPAPHVVVDEVVVNGKDHLPEEVKSLPPGMTNLAFRYTALTFVGTSRVTFQYKLEGFDKNWIDASNRREAFYTNLPPGDYRFLVKVRTFDGVESMADSPVVFTLEPHFYQRGWFLPLCAAGLLLIVWAGYRLRIRRIREHLRLVVAERSRIARELHDTLMQGFSGVTMEMQALSVRLLPSHERDTLMEIIRDAGNCLREARRSVAGLRNVHGAPTGLDGTIAAAARQLTETQDIRLKLSLAEPPTGLPTDVQYNLLRISQEAVTNAVKHSGAGTVEVALECDPHTLRLSIHDDGGGFNTGEFDGSPAGHYGLIGMRERATQIGAVLDISSRPTSGTTVSVTLPLTASGVPGAGDSGKLRVLEKGLTNA